ncbi:hypothetical protein HDU99_003471 [Rhizoclosmatium hyalinum]|nr:hypothetical protein HDU99_003471 [Rhizoclosmatium hyalinum]
MPKTVLVVGGGAFGLSAALSLQKRGYQATVFDRLPIPAVDAASTDISKVIRPDYATQTLYQTLALDAIDAFKTKWNPDAQKRFGIPLYTECGSLFATRSPTMTEFEQQSIETLQKDPRARVERVGKDVIAASMGSAFANEFPYGYVNHSAGFADSGLTMRYLAEIAGEAGVKFVVGKEKGAFLELIEEGGKVVGIVTVDGVKHFGDMVLMAAGAWTSSLLPALQGLCTVSAQPVIHFKLPDTLKAKFEHGKFPVWFADVSNTGFYGFPVSAAGELKIANHGPGFMSSFHNDTKPASVASKSRGSIETPTAIPKESVEMYRKFLAKAFPELNKLDISRTRLCWYCESWDGNFYIDAVPEKKNLFVATGGSGHGFKFVSVLGDVIADIVEGKNTPFRKLFKWRPREVEVVDAIRQKTTLKPKVLEQVVMASNVDLAARIDSLL